MATEHIFKSKVPDVDVPTDISLPMYILNAAAKHGDKVAYIAGDEPNGRQYTFTQVVGMTRKFAQGLSERGFKQGDILAIFAPNVPEYSVVWLGTSLIGGITTTCNPLYTTDDLVKQLKIAKATWIFTVCPFLDKVRDAAQQVGLDADKICVFDHAEGVLSLKSFLANDGNAVPEVIVNVKEDILVLPFSSGTTGLPKGVMLTHYNVLANILQYMAFEGDAVRKDDTLLAVLPFFHIYGMVPIMCFSLLIGWTVITMMKFDMVRFLENIQTYKVSYLHLVPPIILGLAKHPITAKYDLSSLWAITSGAAPLGAEIQEEFSKKFPHIKVRQGYGMSETSPVSHACRWDNIVYGAAGELFPNMEAKIVDPDTGKAVGVNETGELWLRGPNVMKGYLNDPVSTANTIDSAGFIHTGDIVKVDEKGLYYVTDRLKELLKWKGNQVAPAELEALLVTHPAISDAAVVGIPDAEAGDLPKAHVVLKAGQTTSEDEIIEWLSARVAPTKRLRGGVEFATEIPKTASGKILRRVLKEKELQRIREKNN